MQKLSVKIVCQNRELQGQQMERKHCRQERVLSVLHISRWTSPQYDWELVSLPKKTYYLSLWPDGCLDSHHVSYSMLLSQLSVCFSLMCHFLGKRNLGFPWDSLQELKSPIACVQCSLHSWFMHNKLLEWVLKISGGSGGMVATCLRLILNHRWKADK